MVSVKQSFIVTIVVDHNKVTAKSSYITMPVTMALTRMGDRHTGAMKKIVGIHAEAPCHFGTIWE